LKELHIIFFFRYINIYISISIPDFQFNLADKLMLKKFGILTGEMIDTWVDAAGKNGMRRDWIIRDYHTQEIITRATRYSFFRFQLSS